MTSNKGIINILLSGFNGRMGTTVREVAKESGDFFVVAGVSYSRAIENESSVLNVFSSFRDIKNVKADVIIDFSHADSTKELLKFATKFKIPTVIGTTGHTNEQLEIIKDVSDFIPVFFSQNMSIGANILLNLCKRAARLLKNSCDIEIVEKHHNRKKDAPSGTALMFAEELKKALNLRECNYIFDRTNRSQVRKSEEIGISSVRAGTIVGEHSVIFGLDNEILTLTHTAQSRKIFAKGALLAAKFILNKEPGFYTMKDICEIGGFC